MIELALILLGSDFVKRQWWWLAGIGVVWAMLGVAIVADAIGDIAHFSLHPFGHLLLAGAAIVVLLSGTWLLRQAARLARRPERISMAVLLSKRLPAASSALHAADSTQVSGLLVVHVWTPLGSAGKTIPHPLLDRFIAAVDGHGTITTGHAALECTPDIYVSHHPLARIDPSHAIANHDVGGMFQSSYEVEAAGWCDSTAHVVFNRFDRARLASFWNVYRQDTTYNLTRRNAASSVARCLEAALEDSLGAGATSLAACFRVIFNPELWYAAQLRKQAEATTWTPALLLDYARALQAAIAPASVSWESFSSGIRRAWRYGVAVFAAGVFRRKPGVTPRSRGGR